MKARVLVITGTFLAFFMGSPVLGGSFMKENDRMRGTMWEEDRAVSQNMPSSQDRNRSFDANRDSQSRDQFRRTPEQYNREFNRSRQNRDRFRRDHLQNRQYREQDQYSKRSERGRMAQRLSGILVGFQRDSVVVNTKEGDRQRLHVNKNTLLDAGIERGDRIIAHVRPDGHAIAIRKDRGRRGEHFVQPGSSKGRHDSRFQRRDDRSSFQDEYGRSQRRSDSGRYRP